MHKSGYIAISRLRAWIVDEVYISKKNIQIHIFPIPTQHFFAHSTIGNVEPLSCPYLVIKLHGKYTKLTVTQKLVNK